MASVSEPSAQPACGACAFGCKAGEALSAAPPNLLGVAAVVFGAPLLALMCAALILQHIESMGAESLGALGQLGVSVAAVLVVCLLVRRFGQRLAQWLRRGYEN